MITPGVYTPFRYSTDVDWLIGWTVSFQTQLMELIISVNECYAL